MNPPDDLQPRSIDDRRTPSVNARTTIPPSERGEDRSREEFVDQFEHGPARPLTDEEKEAAAHDRGVEERVYAPASERVPREPIPGHDELVEHPDPTTPERLSSALLATDVSAPTPLYVARETEETPLWERLLPFAGACAAALAAAAFFVARRRRQEANKPLNRARRAASQALDRLPDPDEVRRAVAERPTAASGSGLALALMLLSLFLSRRDRSEQDAMLEVYS